MIDPSQIANLAAFALSSNPRQMSMDIDTSGFTSQQVLDLIDALFPACEAKGIKLKGVMVDPMQVPLPANADYLNAFTRNGRLVIVDLNTDDKVVARRART